MDDCHLLVSSHVRIGASWHRRTSALCFCSHRACASRCDTFRSGDFFAPAPRPCRGSGHVTLVPASTHNKVPCPLSAPNQWSCSRHDVAKDPGTSITSGVLFFLAAPEVCPHALGFGWAGCGIRQAVPRPAPPLHRQ